MPESLTFKTWNENNNYSSQFKMVSKYTDLGSPDGKKSILGIICNISIGTDSTSTSHSAYSFLIQNRNSVNGTFKTIDIFNNIIVSGNNNAGPIEKVKMLHEPIIGIRHIQLRIKGLGIKGDFGINDIGLIFRTYRDSTTVSFDDN